MNAVNDALRDSKRQVTAFFSCFGSVDPHHTQLVAEDVAREVVAEAPHGCVSEENEMRILALAVLLLAGVALTADDTDGKHTLMSFVSAGRYRQMPPAFRTATSAVGWTGGSMRFCWRLDGTYRASEAIRYRQDGQSDQAIVDKYMTDHPET